jgi:uncharacterized membrane protein YphA (DoxX/SURF4 family)
MKRADYAMLLGSIFLLIVGAGGWSIDGKLSKQTEEFGHADG